MPISIPRAFQTPLKAFSEVPQEERERLAEAFVGVAALPSVAGLTAEVYTRSELKSLTPDGLEDMIRAFVSVSIYCDRTSTDADEILKALAADEKLGGEAWGAAGVPLKKILGSKSLRSVARAVDVSVENERTVRSSRICTDIRPVFTEGTAELPTLAVLLHTLRFECDGEFQHEYFTLSPAALRRLKTVVDRALEKEKALGMGLVKGLAVQLFEEDEQR